MIAQPGERPNVYPLPYISHRKTCLVSLFKTRRRRYIHDKYIYDTIDRWWKSDLATTIRVIRNAVCCVLLCRRLRGTSNGLSFRCLQKNPKPTAAHSTSESPSFCLLKRRSNVVMSFCRLRLSSEVKRGKPTGIRHVAVDSNGKFVSIRPEIRQIVFYFVVYYKKRLS